MYDAIMGNREDLRKTEDARRMETGKSTIHDLQQQQQQQLEQKLETKQEGQGSQPAVGMPKAPYKQYFRALGNTATQETPKEFPKVVSQSQQTTLVCFGCGKTGHLRRDCKAEKRTAQTKNE
jgi:hypothetical protein